jgi:1-acyl-sn-glycerol-3-phosphate acyltransferase
MDLAPHLKLFIQGHPLDVIVTWGEPISFNGNRKQATAFAEAEVRRALKAA